MKAFRNTLVEDASWCSLWTTAISPLKRRKCPGWLKYSLEVQSAKYTKTTNKKELSKDAALVELERTLRHFLLPVFVCFAYFVVASTALSAQPLIQHSFTNLNLTIPDNDASGLVNIQNISGSPKDSVVLDVNVLLKLSGDAPRNGDLFVTLDHQSGYSVLLNRVGRTENNIFGYLDPGFEITLDDEARNGDVHLYRATLFGNHETPVRQALSSAWSGNWAPDGRIVDPDEVTEISPRRATLGSMKGLPVDGRWRLYLADVAPGGVSQLEEWSLVIGSTTNLNDLKFDLTDATIRADGEERIVTAPVTIRGGLSVSGTATTALSGPVSGSGQLVKNGGGILDLGGVNTFSGGIDLEEGALVLSNDRAVGLGPITLKGGSLTANGGDRRLDNAISLQGNLTFGAGDKLVMAGSVSLLGVNSLAVENDTEITSDILESEPGGGFIKSGGGKLTLSGANTFSGGIALEDGTLALGNDRALGTGTLSLKGGKLATSGGDRKLPNPVKLSGTVGISGGMTFTGDITLEQLARLEIDGTMTLSGPMKEENPGTGFVKSGNGTLVLEGANTISGGVQIEDGTLSVNNLGGSATGSGPVTLGSRATLKGNGTIAGSLGLASGSVLAPGASPGQLTTGNQTWPGGAVLEWELNDANGTEGSNPGWDTLKINGNLTIDASAQDKFTLQVVSLASNDQPGPAVNFDPVNEYAWNIAQTTEGVTGFDPNAFEIDTSRHANGLNGRTLRLAVRGNNLALVFELPKPPQVYNVELVAGGVRLSIQGTSNQAYRIEATETLIPANWISIGDVQTNALGESEFETPIAANSPEQFFRIVEGGAN